jgi:DNA-binding NtrC family response regulator
MSERKDLQFIPINCATLTDDLMQSELFGHVKGAFTGALQNKIGIIEEADGGTIFLDEISEMSVGVQAKLLRVLQDGIIQPVGSNQGRKVDVRFICASNQELSRLVEQNKFREDLYFRLNVIEIEVPSLAARKSDLPILINHFFRKYNKSVFVIDKEALEIIKNYDWPGNIRELENFIQMEIVTNESNKISVESLPQKFFKDKLKESIVDPHFDEEYKTAFNIAMNKFDKNYLIYHLEKNDYNISQTADSINLSRVSIHKKIKEYSIKLKN